MSGIATYAAGAYPTAHACNCIGPQNGEPQPPAPRVIYIPLARGVINFDDHLTWPRRQNGEG